MIIGRRSRAISAGILGCHTAETAVHYGAYTPHYITIKKGVTMQRLIGIYNMSILDKATVSVFMAGLMSLLPENILANTVIGVLGGGLSLLFYIDIKKDIGFVRYLITIMSGFVACVYFGDYTCHRFELVHMQCGGVKFLMSFFAMMVFETLYHLVYAIRDYVISQGPAAAKLLIDNAMSIITKFLKK